MGEHEVSGLEQTVSAQYLLGQAHLGDRRAFEEIVHRFGPALHRYARRMLADEGDADDAVQDTFVAAWKQAGAFRGQSSVQTWLFSICSRKVVDLYRAKRAKPVSDYVLADLPAVSASEDPFLSASNTCFIDALEVALDELPRRQRASWVLREVEFMSFPDIGKVLNSGPDAVRGHHARATKNLSSRLRRWR